MTKREIQDAYATQFWVHSPAAGPDNEVGRILEYRNGEALVAWKSGVRTWIDFADLEVADPEVS